MIITIIIVSIAFIWLGIESRWLTVRLPVGNHKEAFDRMAKEDSGILFEKIK